MEAPSRRAKSKIIDEVVSQIAVYGGFVKKTSAGRWLAIASSQSRDKVAHHFRDSMKHFKGNMPADKETIWREAQNAIFANMHLCAPPPVHNDNPQELVDPDVGDDEEEDDEESNHKATEEFIQTIIEEEYCDLPYVVDVENQDEAEETLEKLAWI